MKPLPVLSFPPDQLAKLQAQYGQEMQQLWEQGLQANPTLKDRRFAAQAWQHNPVAAFSAAIYLLNARTLLAMSDMVDTDEKTRARIRFSIEQWVAAASPSNFLALNAEAQQKAIDTKGESITKGLHNMWHDLQQGHVSMTDESQFEVGKNVATSEGAVVFENEIFQLIEYKPLTP
jgi:polyhydroxyalkanoate synthase